MYRLIAALAVVAFATACDRGSDTPAPPEPTPPAAAPAEPAAPAIPCALTRGEAGIQNIQLTADDGSCRLYLPATPAVGELQVRVSAVGDDSAAAVEAATDGGTLFATEGTVVVTSVEDGHVVGRIDARDAAEPVTGRIEATFDVVVGTP